MSVSLEIENGRITLINDEGDDREITKAELDKMLTPGTGRQFAKVRGSYTIVDEVQKRLDPGAYSIVVTREGLFFNPYIPQGEPVLDLPDSAAKDVFKEVEKFWNIGDFFQKRKYVRKRGILLFGPPGTGKTSCLNRLCNFVAERDGLVLFPIGMGAMKMGLKAIRDADPKRMILCVLEDVEGFMRQDEHGLLAILDGQDQIDNILYLATTNYLKSLPPRLRNRPSRFDLVRRVGFPTAAARYAFLKAKTDMSHADCTKWAEATEGLSFAHLKELDIAVNGFGADFDMSVKRVRSMEELVTAEKEEKLDYEAEGEDED